MIHSRPAGFGVRGDLRADGDACPSCGLGLDLSSDLQRFRTPVEGMDGRVTSGEIEFVAGVCLCDYRWAIIWRVDP